MTSLDEVDAPSESSPRTIRSRYRLESPIGSGSMGVVYKAQDEETGQECAVKLLRSKASNRQQLVSRFLDEAKTISRLYHPNIIEIFDHGEEPDGTLFLTMELLRGRDLHSLLQAEGRLPLNQTLSIARQIGSALHMVHLADIVHRDIKPRNIFLAEAADDPHQYQVKVIDFGLAKLLNPASPKQNSDGLLIGTPEYLPPEAWSGISADVDGRADQWALAVLLYRMLSGRLPFDSANNTVSLAREIISGIPLPLRELQPDVPEYVESALRRALSKEKEKRFSSVADFVRAICNKPRILADARPSCTPEKITVIFPPDPNANHPTEPFPILDMQTTRILTPSGIKNALVERARAVKPARTPSEPTHLTTIPLRRSKSPGGTKSAGSAKIPKSQTLRAWLPFSLNVLVMIATWCASAVGYPQCSAASPRPEALSEMSDTEPSPASAPALKRQQSFGSAARPTGSSR